MKITNIFPNSSTSSVHFSHIESQGSQNGQMTQENVSSQKDKQELRAQLISQHAAHSSQESASGATGSTTEGQGSAAHTLNNNECSQDDSNWDDPDGFEILWSEDLDTAHPFTKAALTGDVTTVTEYSQRSTFDPNAKKSQHALLAACRAGNVEIVKTLLEAGVDVHCRDSKSNWQPIHIATYRDHVAIVESLAMHGEWRRGVALVRFKGVTCSLLHLAGHFGCLAVLRYLLSHTVRLGLHIEVRDAAHWTAIHHAAFEGRTQALTLLSQAGADVNSADPHGVTPLHLAAYKDHVPIVRQLLSRGANPRLLIKSAGTAGHEGGFERVEPVVKYFEGSSLLHWAASKGHEDLVADLLARGLMADAFDRDGRTPLGLAVWAGQRDVVKMLMQEKVQLSEEDKNWHRVLREEEGLTIIKILEETGVATLESCRSDGFTLLHLASNNGYPNMMHRLLSLQVSPDLSNNQGETPLFMAIRSNQLACVQQLINAGTRVNIVDNRGGTPLHMAAKNGNVTVIDMLLTTSESQERDIDINLTDNIGYTAVYYAVNALRYDIVQRFLEYSLVMVTKNICDKHVMATKNETLLQFYTDRNNLGQYDNAVVRVLECEKLLHTNKVNAEMCLRSQLGTTEASTKARIQLQQMYESTKAQRHCWNFWFFLSCFFLPSIFYYLDVYTDVLLAVEYYKDALNASLCDNDTDTAIENFADIFKHPLEPNRANFLLTIFFILLPMSLLSLWNWYIHITQDDILPLFRKLGVFRTLFYTLIFFTPLAPVMAYMENTYAQMKHMNVTARSLQEIDSKSYSSFPCSGNTKTYRHHMRDQKIRKYCDLKHVAQMRVAITNVMEATLESAFQLILQLYIVGTQYNKLSDVVGEATLRKIFSFSRDGQDTRLPKQVFSVLISLVSLTWSFTSYHRFSKLGGLSILSSLPLLFSIFFQVVSRAIACTIFTLSYKWKIFVVLGVHFVIVLFFKLQLEETSQVDRRRRQRHTFLSTLRAYFYVFLGTIASTLVYFRLERPSDVRNQLANRHSTVVIQVIFLVLAFIENFVLLFSGIVGLDENVHDIEFQIVSIVLCTLSYIIGVVLHGVYYGCYGHPWVDINGPTISHDTDEGVWIIAYYRHGFINRWAIHSCCNIKKHPQVQADNIYLPRHLLHTKFNGVPREVKDI